ncbi:hypothetical protein, partial [Gorillibacterium massiliense]|uniref:hypothetical protein n=1 Tax=Gorillibacterium massiliense TaxID=1280390 RepID=UPI0005949DA6
MRQALSLAAGEETSSLTGIQRLAAASLLFLLLRECLESVLRLSLIDSVMESAIFYAALGSFLLIDLLPGGIVLRTMMKVAAMVAAIGLLFYPESFASLSWIGSYLDVCFKDLFSLRRGDYEGISFHNRTMFFLFGWLMLSSVLHGLVRASRRIIWLPAGVLFLLLFLQLSTGLDTSAETVRAVAIGLALAALQRQPALVRDWAAEAASADGAANSPGRAWPAGWLLTAAGLGGLC